MWDASTRHSDGLQAQPPPGARALPTMSPPDERKLARIVEVYSTARGSGAQTLDAREQGAPPVDSSRYIFIVGLPRSGTTLVERILSGLPGVRSNGETENFSRSLLAAARGPGDVFQQAAAADAGIVAANYAAHAGGGRSSERIIEKLPMNYLYLGGHSSRAARRTDPGAPALSPRRLFRHVPHAVRRRLPLYL